MAMQERQRWCYECERYRLCRRSSPNHVLHLLLSVVTVGLWLWVWLFLTLFVRGHWQCSKCGSKYVYRNERKVKYAGGIDEEDD
jgi:hypothetical protein